MITIIMWFAALICHNPMHTPAHHGNCNLIHLSNNASTLDDEEDTGIGGETGGTHKPPIPPPPPPFGG